MALASRPQPGARRPRRHDRRAGGGTGRPHPPLARAAREASAHLPGGVASSWQDAPPCPVFVERGAGLAVWDVDGTEYVDLHGGFGTMLAGHGHPAIVAAVSARVGRRHPLRPAGARHHPRRRRARPPLRPADVALRQLRHRGDARRRPPDARRHRPRRRSSRSRAATTVTTTPCRSRCTPRPTAPARPTGRLRCPSTPPSPPRSPRLIHVVPFGRLDAVRRVLLDHPGRDRRDDRRAGDDEHRRRPAAARLPRRARPRCCTPTARC